MKAAVLLLLVPLVLMVGCGGGSDAVKATADDFAGAWSFQEQPTANNPVREASLTFEKEDGGRMTVGGRLATALAEFGVSGAGTIEDSVLKVDLTCSPAEGDPWQAKDCEFSKTPEGKVRARVPSKRGPMMVFDLSR